MSNVNRNSNWGYLPDYSHQNHTLKFARKSRNGDTYERPDAKIPAVAWVYAAVFAAIGYGVMYIGVAAGY